MSTKNNPQKLFERAAGYAQQGLQHKAIPLYEKLLKLFPDQPEIGIQLAHSMGLAGYRIDALNVHTQLEKDFGISPEILIRCARDREQWQDIEGSLATYERLFEIESKWRRDAAYHRIRLYERLNRIDLAEKALSEAGDLGFIGDEWGWLLVQGNLARRRGDDEIAESLYHQAERSAPPEGKSAVTSALARLADSRGLFQSAHQYIQITREYRQIEAGECRGDYPVPSDHAEIPELRIEDGVKNRPIFLAGMPRSGTSLLSRLLEQKYCICQSEEYDFASQLVNRFLRPGGKLLSPAKIANQPKSIRNKALNAYYESQRQSVGYEKGEADILLDKNPSLSLLSPWLLALIPGLRILWIDRPLPDVWLSSVMQDVPINGATCWWQDPSHYLNWARPMLALRDSLEEKLGSNRFHRLSYESLVTSPDLAIQSIAEKFQLGTRDSLNTDLAPARSPTYVEVSKPINSERQNRWLKYREFYDDDEQKLMDSWYEPSS